MHAAPPRHGRAPLLRFLLASAVALVLAHLVDRWAYVHLAAAELSDTDLGRMLRVMGFLPLWATAALALVLHDRPERAGRGAWARGLLLLGSATLGGAAAEVLKLVFRRERPRAHAGEYVFRAWTERPFSTGGLALPSSHALVAWGAAGMLAHLFPRARWVWYALAAGSSYSRVAAGAHFVSDVVLSAVVGLAVAEGLWRWRGPHEGRPDAVERAGHS
ncbi:MAG TPA: phosphatase PAP2 family protein [Longimicrobiaceae bacterium]|nr:phosphatase PAP2 family protein [Longimicrobiaceae bacterium]